MPSNGEVKEIILAGKITDKKSNGFPQSSTKDELLLGQETVVDSGGSWTLKSEILERMTSIGPAHGVLYRLSAKYVYYKSGN